jgi:hypothetical protein
MEKLNTAHYANFGGVNEKSSKYSMQNSQCLNLRNLDFYVPNALQKTPGSTLLAMTGSSGPITALYEFEKLTGESYFIIGTNATMYIRVPGVTALSALSNGWDSQPLDILTFVNRAWIAGGVKSESYDGTSLFSYGLISNLNAAIALPGGAVGTTMGNFSVLGTTMAAYTGATTGQRSVMLAAYAYVRADGYMSPVDVINTARVISPFEYEKNGILGASYLAWQGPTTGGNYGRTVPMNVYGFTNPTGQSLLGYALFLAMDTWTGVTATMLNTFIRSFSTGTVTDNSLNTPTTGLRSTADVTNFRYFTLVPAIGGTFSITGVTLAWSELYNTLPSFSLMTFNYFATFVPKYFEINQNRMFAAGFSAAPSQIFFSDVGAPEVYDAESNFEVRTNDGDKILGIKTFQNQLIVFKKRSFHKLIGTDEDSFKLVELSTQYGCLSNNAIVEYDNKLLFLDQEGIVEFNGANWQIISTSIEPTFRRMNVSVATEKAVGVHYQERNQVWFGIPVDGSTVNNLTVVYDYLLNAWTFIEGFSPSVYASVKRGLDKRTNWYGTSGGQVFFMSPSFLSYNGVGFTSVLETAFDSPDGADKENMYRRFFLDVNQLSGITGRIDVDVKSNYDRDTVKATFSIYQNQFQTRADFGVPGKAIGFKLVHSGVSLPLLINGYNHQRRFLRNV